MRAVVEGDPEVGVVEAEPAVDVREAVGVLVTDVDAVPGLAEGVSVTAVAGVGVEVSPVPVSVGEGVLAGRAEPEGLGLMVVEDVGVRVGAVAAV